MQPKSSRTSRLYRRYLRAIPVGNCLAFLGFSEFAGRLDNRMLQTCAIRHSILPVLIILAATYLAGCGVSRSTTSVRSAVEAALVSKAIRDAVGSLSIPGATQTMVLPHAPKQQFKNSFYIQPLSITTASRVNLVLSTEDVRKPIASDDAYNTLLKHLLERGYSLAPSAETAQYHIYPTLHYAEVDDNQYTLGIPSIPIPTANLGTVNTPELALLGLHSQFGRAKISVLIIEHPTGSYVGTFESPVTQSSYNRWKLLLFFGWRTTDLPKPF